MNPRDVRDQLGLTQKELANRLGVSVRAVQSWEQGWRSPRGPAEKILEELSEKK